MDFFGRLEKRLLTDCDCYGCRHERKGVRKAVLAFQTAMVGKPITGQILQFPHDDKPWTPATHFRAEGSHSSLALADGLIGIDEQEAVAIVFGE